MRTDLVKYHSKARPARDGGFSLRVHVYNRFPNVSADCRPVRDTAVFRLARDLVRSTWTRRVYFAGANAVQDLFPRFVPRPRRRQCLRAAMSYCAPVRRPGHHTGTVPESLVGRDGRDRRRARLSPRRQLVFISHHVTDPDRRFCPRDRSGTRVPDPTGASPRLLGGLAGDNTCIVAAS